jgi:hypothetical protein
LILKKMKERGIEVGSGIPNKKYDSKEVFWINSYCKLLPRIKREKIKNYLGFFN